MLKKCHYYIIFFLAFLLFSCATTKHNIEKIFKPAYKSANIALKFFYTIRNQSDTIPELFYIQNLKTFEWYKMEYDSDNIFHIKNLPLGEYRVGFWTGIYKADKYMFRMFTYSYYTFELNKTGDYNLGHFKYKCNVDSSIVIPTYDSFEPMSINKKEYLSYKTIYVKKSQIDIKETAEYKEYGYGFSRDVEYIATAGGTIIQEKNLYGSFQSDPTTNKSVINESMFNSMLLEKAAMREAIKEIYLTYSNSGLSEALNLITKYKKSSDDNINLLIVTSFLYYKENNLDYAKYIMDEVNKRDPNCGEYFSLLAILEKDGDLEKTKEYLYRAISLKTSWTISYNQYADILLKENHIEYAEMLNDYAIEADSNNIDYLETGLKIAVSQKNQKKIVKIENKLKELK